MYEITIENSFSAAHRLNEYHGKCESVHGHNWKVQIVIESAELNKAGMVLDFKIAKNYLRNILKKLDHQFLNEIYPFNEINPTSENLAAFIYRELKKKFKKNRYDVAKVTVFETEHSSASFSRKEAG